MVAGAWEGGGRGEAGECGAAQSRWGLRAMVKSLGSVLREMEATGCCKRTAGRAEWEQNVHAESSVEGAPFQEGEEGSPGLGSGMAGEER